MVCWRARGQGSAPSWLFGGFENNRVGEGVLGMVVESFRSFTCKMRGKDMGGAGRDGLGVMV